MFHADNPCLSSNNKFSICLLQNYKIKHVWYNDAQNTIIALKFKTLALARYLRDQAVSAIGLTECLMS